MEVKQRTNGTHRHNTRDPYHGSRSKRTRLRDKEEYAGQGTLPRSLQGRYKAEKFITYLGLMLLAGAGIDLAIKTASNPFMMLMQVAGFVASTVSIMTVKQGMGQGIYIGNQYRFAKTYFRIGLAFESLTLLAKYYPPFIQIYLITVAFSLPGVILAMWRLENLDDDIRLYRMRKEAQSVRITLKTEARLLQEAVPYKKQLATLRAEDNIQDRRNDRMMKKSKGLSAWFRVNKLANEDMVIVYKNVRTKEQKREANKLKRSASDAKVIGSSTKRRTRKGPRAETAVNGIYCKAKGCKNKLSEGQRKYCSEKCGNRERARKLRERRKA